MKKMIQENIVKNIILLVLLSLSYEPIKNFLNSSSLIEDKATTGDILVVVSIIIVTACFGAFAFTYEKTKSSEKHALLLAHATTGILMLIIGLSLEMTAILTSFLIEDFVILNKILALLYIGVVCYDFWDLLRIKL
jgi:small-conductance mechanosensitive channel